MTGGVQRSTPSTRVHESQKPTRWECPAVGLRDRNGSPHCRSRMNSAESRPIVPTTGKYPTWVWITKQAKMHAGTASAGRCGRSARNRRECPERQNRDVRCPKELLGAQAEELVRGDVPCAVETERRLGSRLRNHFRRLAEPELRVARSERRHQLRHVLAAVHAPKALGGFQHPGRDPA